MNYWLDPEAIKPRKSRLSVRSGVNIRFWSRNCAPRKPYSGKDRLSIVCRASSRKWRRFSHSLPRSLHMQNRELAARNHNPLKLGPMTPACGDRDDLFLVVLEAGRACGSARLVDRQAIDQAYGLPALPKVQLTPAGSLDGGLRASSRTLPTTRAMALGANPGSISGALAAPPEPAPPPPEPAPPFPEPAPPFPEPAPPLPPVPRASKPASAALEKIRARARTASPRAARFKPVRIIATVLL